MIPICSDGCGIILPDYWPCDSEESTRFWSLMKALPVICNLCLLFSNPTEKADWGDLFKEYISPFDPLLSNSSLAFAAENRGAQFLY